MAEFTVRVNPAVADPNNPLGEVIEVQENDFAWSLQTRREFAIVKVPNATVQDIVDTYHAHRNTPDDNPIPTQITIIDVVEIPDAAKALIQSYLDRIAAEGATYEAVGRAPLIAAIEQARGALLSDPERGLGVNALLGLGGGQPWQQAARKAYRLAYQAARDADTVDFTVPPIVQLGKQKLRQRTVTVPYPVI